MQKYSIKYAHYPFTATLYVTHHDSGAHDKRALRSKYNQAKVMHR
jgi:hypothetical protein